MTTIYASAWETLDNDRKPLGDNLVLFASLADANAHALAEVSEVAEASDGCEISRKVETYVGTKCLRVASTFTWGSMVSHVHAHEIR